jgi:dolichyl-phosphate-mannose-protein mannosyltransferase
VLAFIVFPAHGFEGDLELHRRWLIVLADVGPGAFYGHTQEVLPPGFTWVLWPFAIIGRGLEVATGASLEGMAWALVKIPAMAADTLIAVLLYRVVGRWANRRAGLLATALFLFIPVTWYESAIWGQIDSVGSLLLLAALVALDLGWSEASFGSAIAATLVKPQFGIGLIVVTLALVRRHLRADPRRLATSVAVGIAVALIVVLPFDLEERAPDPLRNVPVAGDVAGLVTIVGQQASKDPVLAANAFTPWALVGPNPLPRSGIAHWSDDGLRLFGDVTAFTLGLWLAGAAFLIGGVVLLLRADRPATHLAVATFLTVALFLLPTRVHERYVFPVFAVAAPLAAVSRLWRAWYVLVGLATTANLHAVLTYGGTLGVTSMPLGHELQTPTAITVIALSQGALGVVTAVLVLADVGGAALTGRTLAAARGGNLRRWLLRLRAPTRSSAPAG